MSQKRDYYEILGISKNANGAEIKKAYRKLAMQYHPDRNPGNKEAEAKFREATEAYEILKDDQKRGAYDQYGHQAFSQNGGASGFEGFDFNDIFSNFSDIFSDFSNQGRSNKRSAAHRGSDVRYNIDISLKEAFEGCDEKISFNIMQHCKKCDGTGSASKEKPSTCTTCNGSGKIRAQQGFFIVERACTTCNGTGEIIKDPCGTCNGQGRSSQNKTLSVKIPAGVEDGSRIRLSNEGEAGQRGGPAGDLYVFVSVRKHEFFTRKGDDIYFDVPIKLTTAALGGHVDIPTIDGAKARLKIPEGTQHDDPFRLKSKGMNIMNSGGRRGNMFVKAKIEVPVNISKKERELLEELDQLISNKKNSPNSESFFKKMGDFFG